MRELRLVLLGLAAVLSLLLGTTFLMRAFNPRGADRPQPQTSVADMPRIAAPGIGSPEGAAPVPSTAATSAARAALERGITDAPAYAKFFDRMRLLFPSDYETIMNGLAQTTAGHDIDIDKVASQADAAIRRQHGKLEAEASDAALSQVFATDLQAMQALSRRDTHLCVSYLFNASGSGFFGFAADHRDLVADIAIAGLDAMNSGRMDTVHRAPPSDDDLQAFDRALVTRGLTRPQIEVLLDGKVADPPIADDAMCQAGITYLETLAAMAPDVRARFYSLAVGLRS